MKHHRRTKRMISLLVLSVLTAASGQQATADTALILTGTVHGWERGEAQLELVLFSEDALEESPRVATSTLDADGSFELTVPASVPDETLGRGDVLTLCGGSRLEGNVSELTWKEAFAGLLVTQGGEPLGLITPASSQRVAGFGRGEAGDFFVGLLYVDRDLTIQGSCGRRGPSFMSNYDAQLTEGWNYALLAVDEITQEGSMAMSARVVSDLPEGISWFYTSLEDLWGADEP